MVDLVEFALREKYAEVKKFRSKLSNIKNIINWNKFKRIEDSKKNKIGRPSYDFVLMIKCLILQSWYNLSDEELEFQINDRFSFQEFLDFPKNVPDYTTIWRFKEYIQENSLADKIWSELQRQINNMNLTVEKGQLQDARFIDADPGKQSSDKIDRGRQAKTSRNADGTWSKKNGRWHFGYKLHTKVQCGSKLITEIGVTTASVHDSKIDLSNPDDDVIYKDKAWSGTKTKCKGNGCMKKGNLSVKDILRNKRIAKKRSPVEHPYGIMKRVLNAGTTKRTTVIRVFIQQLFVGFAYNLFRLRTLLAQPSVSFNNLI